MTVLLDYVPAGAQDSAVGGSLPNLSRVGTACTAVHDTRFPFQLPASWRLQTTAYGALRAEFTAVAQIGVSVELEVPTLPAAGAYQVLMTWGNGSSRGGTFGVTGEGEVKIQDLARARGTSTSLGLRQGDRIRVVIKAQPGSTTGHRLRIFTGSNIYGTTPDYDSGDVAATEQTAITTLTYVMLGQPIGTGTLDLTGGRWQINDTGADPGSGYTGVPPVTSVTVGAPASGAGLKVDWSAATSQTAARVFRSASARTGYVALAEQPSAAGAGTFTDTTADASSAYYYQVKRQNGSGWSPTTVPGTQGTRGSTSAPATGSSTVLRPTADVSSNGATPVNPASTTLASCLNESSSDPANYVDLIPQGSVTVRLETPTATPAANSRLQLDFTLVGQTNHYVITEVKSGSTVVYTDIARNEDGAYRRTLNATETAAIDNWADVRVTFTAQADDYEPDA